MRITDNVDDGGTFMVAVHGHIFVIQDDFQVSESRDNYNAVGSGVYCALGSLATSIGNPKKRLVKALDVASKFSTGVEKPFTILSMRSPGR